MYRLILIFLLLASQVIAQTPRKPLSRTINRPSDNQIAPCLSGDGRTMIYMSTYSESREFEVKISTLQKGGVWTDPEDIDVLNRWTSNNMRGGYFLSYDGKTIVFTSRKVPGIGKFDIWITQKRGNSWSAPINLGKPVNSPSNEGSPSLSPDGKLLYFMRCEKMTTTSAENCKLMVAERRGQFWNEPQYLPAPINVGHETFPKIQGDNQTLIFSSDRPGGKGKLDYYLSRFENGKWQQPKAMDYLNTAEDDQFVSIPLKGNIAYYSMKYRGYDAIIKAQIPEDLQPRKVTLIDGTVIAGGYSEEVFLQVYDIENGELVQHGRPSKDGKFMMILPEGRNYDFSATPKDGSYLYYAKIYEQEDMISSTWEKAAIDLNKLEKGYSWSNYNISFVEGTADLASTSEYEMKRLIKLLKSNADINLGMEVYMDEVIEDTIKSDPDLTELRYDTISYEEDSVVIDTVLISKEPDPDLVDENDLGIENDSLIVKVDSLNNQDVGNELNIRVTVRLDTIVHKVTRYKVKEIYHNDRTSRQAETLDEYFRSRGVPEDRFLILGLGDIDRKVENDSEEDRAINKRVQITIE